MKRRWALPLIGVNLAALLVLVFIYPQLMIAPGALMQAHAELATDCFACHSVGRGVRVEKCSACHHAQDIGLRTTKGVALRNRGLKASFHQQLTEQNCIACHADHAGPLLVRKDRKPFSHDLLRVAVRDQCRTCHQVPDNNLHRRLAGNCQQCHSQQVWKPATFDHAKLFLLDGDHNVECVTCHRNNDYSRYTCYGCHEHQPDRIRGKHQEEGIMNFENCVACHRGPNEREGGRGGERENEDD